MNIDQEVEEWNNWGMWVDEKLEYLRHGSEVQDSRLLGCEMSCTENAKAIVSSSLAYSELRGNVVSIDQRVFNQERAVSELSSSLLQVTTNIQDRVGRILSESGEAL